MKYLTLSFKGKFYLPSMNLRIFCKHPSNIQILLFWCVELLFRSKYPLLLNVAVKLNEKIRKMPKGI
jgi:hypothetical protein